MPLVAGCFCGPTAGVPIADTLPDKATDPGSNISDLDSSGSSSNSTSSSDCGPKGKLVWRICQKDHD